MYVDIRIVRLITRCLVHHVDAPQYSNATIGAWSEIFLIVLVPEAPCFRALTQARGISAKKRPRVEKISSSRYRAYQGMRGLIQGMRELIYGMRN